MNFVPYAIPVFLMMIVLETRLWPAQRQQYLQSQ